MYIYSLNIDGNTPISIKLEAAKDNKKTLISLICFEKNWTQEKNRNTHTFNRMRPNAGIKLEIKCKKRKEKRRKNEGKYL